jgi:pSer/pThr/pTyr-binding forkhead associated (FHA) protein
MLSFLFKFAAAFYLLVTSGCTRAQTTDQTSIPPITLALVFITIGLLLISVKLAHNLWEESNGITVSKWKKIRIIPAQKDLAMIHVKNSDDPTVIGNSYLMNKKRITIGRSHNNEIVFYRDRPVSRNHICIEYKNQRFVLTEILATINGQIKGPTFGTFINGRQVSGNPVFLNTNDEILLGKRLKLRFESLIDIEKTDTGRHMVTYDS